MTLRDEYTSDSPVPSSGSAAPTAPFRIQRVNELLADSRFQAHPPEERKQMLDLALQRANETLVNDPTWDQKAYEAFGKFAADAHLRAGATFTEDWITGPLKAAAHMPLDIVKGIGATAVAGGDAVEGLAKTGQPGEIARTFGRTSEANLRQRADALRMAADRAVSGGVHARVIQEPVDRFLDAVDRGEFFGHDPQQWWTQQDGEIQQAQRRFWDILNPPATEQQTAHPDGSVTVTRTKPGGSFDWQLSPEKALQANSLLSPENAQLLHGYMATRNPALREHLRVRLMRNPDRIKADADVEAQRASPGVAAFEQRFGKGSSEHLTASADPVMLAMNLSMAGGALKGVARGAQAATAKEAFSTQFARGAAHSAAVMGGLGAADTLTQNPDAPLSAVVSAAGKGAMTGLAFHTGATAAGAAFRAGINAVRRDRQNSASVTSGPGATAPKSEGAPRTPSAGAGSSPAAGSSSLASIARAAGERVPMSPQPSFAETAALDAAYFAAVNRGDRETVQRMVDEAARAAGYRFEAWHNSENRFDVFDIGYARTSSDIQAFFFKDQRDPYKEYGRNEYHVYLKLDNPANYRQAVAGFDPASTDDAGIKQRQKLQELGYDGFIVSREEGGMDYAELGAFRSNQIKSADPVTYDEAGNIIPLSQRFNPATPNIQYSFAETALSGATGAVAGVVAAPHLGLTSEEGAFVGTGVGIQLDALGNIIGIAYDALTSKETPSVGTQVPWADLPRKEPVNWDLPPPEAGGSLPKTVRRELPLPSNEPATDSPALSAPGPAEAVGVSPRPTPGRDEPAGTARGRAAETGAVSRPPGEVGTASVSRTIRSAAREHGASVEVDDTVAEPTIETKPDGSRTLKLPSSAVETLSKLPPAERRRAYRALRRRLAAHAAGNLDALFAKLREAYHQNSALGDLVKQVLDLLAKAKQPTRRRTGANTKPKGSSALAAAARFPKMRARLMEDLFTLIAGHLRNEALPLPQEPGEPSPRKTLRKFVKAIAEGKLGEEMRDLAVKAREENRSRTTREAKAKVEKTVEETVSATPEAPKVDVYTGPEEVPLSGTPEEELTSVDLEKPVFYDRTTGGFGVIVRNLEPLPGETVEQAAKRELEDAMRRKAGLPRAPLPPTVPLTEGGYTFMRALHEVGDRFGVYFTGHSSLDLPDVTFLGNQQAGLQVAVSRHYANKIAQLPDPAQRRLHLDAFRAKMALHSVWNSEWRADTRTGYTTHLQDKAIPRTWAAMKQIAATDHAVADGIRAVLELRAGMRLEEETIEAELAELNGSVDEQLAFMEDMARALSQRHRGHPLTEAADGTHLVRDPVGRDRILRQLDGANRALRRAGVPEWSELLEGMEATLDNQNITTSRHRAATRALDALRQTFPALAANVHIVDTLPDMEYAGFERARFTEEDWADISAGYTEGIRDPMSDTIVIIASQISVQPGESVEQAARRVVLHETAHRALQAARTQGGKVAQEWNSIVADVLKAHPAEIAQLRGMGSIYANSDASQIVDEWAVRKLASMTPEQLRAVPRASALGRVVQWLKDLWRRLLGRAPTSERLMQDVVTFYQKGVAALAQSQVPVPVEYADTWSWTPEDGRLTRIVTGQHDPPRRAAMQTGMKKEAQALAKVPGVGRVEIHADLSTLTTDGTFDEAKLTPEQWIQARYHRQPVLITDRGVVVIMDHVAVRPEDAYDAKGRPVSLEMQTRRALRREIDTARARDAANFLRTLPGWEAFTNQLWDTHAAELGRIAEAQVPAAHAQWHRLADTHSTAVLREGELQAYRHDIAARWFTRALAAGELADAQVSRFKELLDGALLTALRPTLPELGSPIDALAAQLDEAKTLNAARQWASQAQAYFEQTSAVIRAGKQPLMAGEKAANSQFMKDSLETAKAMAAAGKSSEEIRAVTGWFPGKYDGKMRWELPDEGANATFKMKWKDAHSFLTRERDGLIRQATVGDVLDHPKLFKAYPEVRNVVVTVQDHPGGSFGARGIAIDGEVAGNEAVFASTLLHEIQHWIQEKEGFARGGNTEEGIGKAIYSSDTILRAKLFLEGEGISPDEDYGFSDQADYVELAREKGWMGAPKNPRRSKTGVDYYGRLAGEIEARDVEARQSYTPEQRKAIAPYSSENIAPEDAIVLYGAGTAQMMPQLSKAGDRTEVFYQGTGPFRVAAPKWRQILTGRLLPKELAEVQQMTKDEMGALKASAARLAKDAQAAILRRVKATGKTELEVHEEMSRAMDDPAEMALLAVSAPDLHAATIALRNMQDNLSDAIAMMTGGKTGAGILNNLGKWSRRGYAVFDADANWNYDSLKAAADAGRKINGLDARKIWDDGRNYLAREQARKHRRWPKLYEAPTPAVLDALMRKLLDRHAWLAAMTGEGKITKDISSLVKRKLDPVKDGALMRLMGVVTNPIERFAASTNFQAQFVSLHQMQQQMRGVMLAMGLASDTMNDVYTVKVGGKEGARNQRWSGFGELWTTPELLGALQSARGVASSADVGHVLLDAFRQLGGEAKAARVAYSPDFWSTNFIGAVMALAGTGDLTLSRKSIRSLAKAWNTMAGAEGIKHSAMPAAERAALDAARELHSRLEASGVINAGFHMEDVLNSLDNQWRNRLTATKPREVVTAAARGALTGAAVGRSFGTVAHVAGAVAGGVAGPLIGAKRLAAFHGTLAKYLVSGPDNFAKLASYLNNYETYARSGLSPAEAHAKAVEVVLNTMPNYAMLPSLMREMSRLGLMGSFIAFRAEALRNLYHNTRYAVQELRSGNPALRARGAARLMGIAFTQSLALGRLAGPFGLLMLMSQADDDEEKAWRETVARPWDANGQPVFLKLDDKEAEYFNAGYLLPQATLAEIINGAVRGQTWETVQAQFVQGNVHLDPLLEAAMNRKRDTGLKVSAYPDGTWQNIAERALWAIHNLEPGYASKLERVSLAALGRSKGSARYDLGNEALRMVGLRLNKVQHEDAIRGDLYGFRDRVATARDLARTKWTQWGGKTADATGRHEQESALAYANREIAQAQADFQIYQDNLGKLGITPEMVRRLMKSRNISLTFSPLKLTPEGPKAAK